MNGIEIVVVANGWIIRPMAPFHGVAGSPEQTQVAATVTDLARIIAEWAATAKTVGTI